MKECANEEPEIQRIIEILAPGFDDTGIGDGTIKRAILEAHMPLRNNDYVRTEKTKISHPIKWIKDLVNR